MAHFTGSPMKSYELLPDKRLQRKTATSASGWWFPHVPTLGSSSQVKVDR